jgi:hypothetical protein
MAVTTGRFCWRPQRISIAQFASAAKEHLRPRRVPPQIETRGRDAVLPRRSAALLYNLPDDGCEILMRAGSSVTFHP